MNLSKEQQRAYNEIIDFIESGVESEYLLMGVAGSGKSYLLSKLIQNTNLFSAILAPTNKAKQEIEKKFSVEERLRRIEVKGCKHVGIECDCNEWKERNKVVFGTLHSFLNVECSIDIKTGKDVWKKKDTLRKKYDLICVDEAGMVGDDMYGYLREEVMMGNVSKLLFIGDDYQIPAKINGKDNLIFENLKERNSISLKEIMRSKELNMKELYEMIRDCVDNKADYEWERLNKGRTVLITTEMKIFAKRLRKSFSEKDDREKCLLTFRNDDVRTYNDGIRKILFGKNVDRYEIGDYMMFTGFYIKATGGNNNFFTTQQQFIIRDIDRKREHHSYYDAEFDIWELECSKKPEDKYSDFTLYVIEEHEEVRYEEMRKEHWKKIKKEIDKNNKLLEKTIEKEEKKKLKKKIKDLWRKYKTARTLFRPPIDYGYALTIHKSQGSTYSSVFIDLRSVLNAMRNAGKKKNVKDTDWASLTFKKLIYTSTTRASHEVVILVDKYDYPITKNV